MAPSSELLTVFTIALAAFINPIAATKLFTPFVACPVDSLIPEKPDLKSWPNRLNEFFAPLNAFPKLLPKFLTYPETVLKADETPDPKPFAADTTELKAELAAFPNPENNDETLLVTPLNAEDIFEVTPPRFNFDEIRFPKFPNSDKILSVVERTTFITTSSPLLMLKFILLTALAAAVAICCNA